MKQELEIEFKNLLTKEEYHKLVSHFCLNDSDFITQENHYFDTADFELKDHHSALRIRVKNNKHILTLKQPHQDGLLETHESLTKDQAEQLINGTVTIQGEIGQLIFSTGINPAHLKYFGTLTTKRAEKKYKNGLIVFDHSFYLGKDDYEVEYEVTDAKQGKAAFEHLLTSFDIPVRHTENKIRRFYNAKYSMLSEE